MKKKDVLDIIDSCMLSPVYSERYHFIDDLFKDSNWNFLSEKNRRFLVGALTMDNVFYESELKASFQSAFYKTIRKEIGNSVVLSVVMLSIIKQIDEKYEHAQMFDTIKDMQENRFKVSEDKTEEFIVVCHEDFHIGDLHIAKRGEAYTCLLVNGYYKIGLPESGSFLNADFDTYNQYFTKVANNVF